MSMMKWLLQAAKEMTHSKMQFFLGEVERFGDDEDIMGIYFEILESMDSEFGWVGWDYEDLFNGLIEIAGDKDSFSLYLNNKLIADGSPLWMVMHVYELIDGLQIERHKDIDDFKQGYGEQWDVHRLFAIEQLFGEKFTDWTYKRLMKVKSKLWPLTLEHDCLWNTYMCNPNMTIDQFCESIESKLSKKESIT